MEGKCPVKEKSVDHRCDGLVVISALVAGRGYISSRSYFRAAGRLSSSLDADLQTKYGEELQDATDKFWSCYDQEICSRNDMTDVMD